MKLYITLGKQKMILSGAGNRVHGCILALGKFLDEDFEGYEKEIGTVFVVSEKGFGEHDDDYAVSLYEVIRLRHIANNSSPISMNDCVEECKVLDGTKIEEDYSDGDDECEDEYGLFN